MADDIKIDITADSSGLRGGLTSASSSVNEFGAKTESLNKVGEKVGKTFEHMGERVKETMSAMMGPLMALASFEGIKGIVEDISRLQKLSEKLDMTAESLQRIKFLSEQTGVEFETVQKSLYKLQQNVSLAAAGNTDLEESFTVLGVSAKELAALPTDQWLGKIADGLKKSTDHGLAAHAIVKLLGKSAGEMGAMFALGGQKMNEVMSEAAVLTNAQVAKIDKVADQLKKMFSHVKYGAAEVFGGVIWYIERMSEGMLRFYAFVTGGMHKLKETNKDIAEYRKQQEEKEKEKKDKDHALENAAGEGGSGEGGGDSPTKKKTEMVSGVKMVGSLDDARKDSEGDSESTKQWKVDQVRQGFIDRGKAKRDADAKKEAEEERKRQEELVKIKGQWSSKADYKAVLEKKEKDKKDAEKAEQKRQVSGAKNWLSYAENEVKKDSVIHTDALRRIGGGFAKANYGDNKAAKDHMEKDKRNLQDARDYLEKILAQVTDSSSSDGVEG